MIVLLRYALVLAALGLWVYCVMDVIRSEVSRVQHLHKLVWLAFVVLVPAIGSLAWLLLGRPEPIGSRFAGPPPAARAPDDSPEYLAWIDDEIRRRRRAERRRPDGEPASGIDKEIERLEEEFKRGEDDEG